jgi:hypothetical protein
VADLRRVQEHGRAGCRLLPHSVSTPFCRLLKTILTITAAAVATSSATCAVRPGRRASARNSTRSTSFAQPRRILSRKLRLCASILGLRTRVRAAPTAMTQTSNLLCAAASATSRTVCVAFSTATKRGEFCGYEVDVCGKHSRNKHNHNGMIAERVASQVGICMHGRL